MPANLQLPSLQRGKSNLGSILGGWELGQSTWVCMLTGFKLVIEGSSAVSLKEIGTLIYPGAFLRSTCQHGKRWLS